MLPALGVWIDDPPYEVRTPQYWDLLVEHGFSTAAIMLEKLEGGWDPKYTPAELERVGKLCLERDIELVLTTWPEPSVEYMKNFRAGIKPLLEISGASGLEYDAEGNWTKKKLKGYPSLDVAGDHLVEIFKEIASEIDCRSELTTFPGHVENTKSADVAPHADRVLPQAYSVRNRTKGVVPWNGTYGPGGMQHHTLRRALEIPGVGTTSGPLISCGLAAYDQTWPGFSPEEAMMVAVKTAMQYQPVELRFWSSKWIFGFKSNGYASKFIKSLPSAGL